MLLIENLIAMVPMLKDLINWMPFNAGHAMLGHVLAESTASPWPESSSSPCSHCSQPQQQQPRTHNATSPATPTKAHRHTRQGE